MFYIHQNTIKTITMGQEFSQNIDQNSEEEINNFTLEELYTRMGVPKEEIDNQLKDLDVNIRNMSFNQMCDLAIKEREIRKEEYNQMSDDEKKIHDDKQNEKMRKIQEESAQKIRDSYDGKIHIANASDTNVRITTYVGDYFGKGELTLIEDVEEVNIAPNAVGFVQLKDEPHWNLDYVMNPILNPKVIKIEFTDTSKVKNYNLSGLNISATNILLGVVICSDRNVVNTQGY